MTVKHLQILTSALYENPLVIFREYVQNSLDSFIEKPVEKPIIDIIYNNEDIIFIDNGKGIEFEQFVKTMKAIDSNKNKNSEQLGFIGIGRISGLPFCEELIFINKAPGKDVQEFVWNNEKYVELLRKNDEKEIYAAINEITAKSTNKYNEYKKIINFPNDNFFVVILKKCKKELKNYIDDKNRSLKNELCKLLPLKYSLDFDGKDVIEEEFKKLTDMSLEKYELDITYNGEKLYKLYNNDNILASNIVIRPIKLYKEEVEKCIGLLWFTFDFRIMIKKSNINGILVRSKNMLIGNGVTIAEKVYKHSHNNSNTFRELEQSISGIFGELLIFDKEGKNEDKGLKENARRDWFNIDEYSWQLTEILQKFTKELCEYRRIASIVHNEKRKNNSIEEKNKKIFKIAYEKLISKESDISFLNNMLRNIPSNKEIDLEFGKALEFDLTIKKFYNKIMLIIKEYYKNVIDKPLEFYKLESYVIKLLNEKNNKK